MDNSEYGITLDVVKSDKALVASGARLHWYEWGNEPHQCVSVGMYSDGKGDWIAMGHRPLSYAKHVLKATPHSPFN